MPRVLIRSLIKRVAWLLSLDGKYRPSSGSHFLSLGLKPGRTSEFKLVHIMLAYLLALSPVDVIRSVFNGQHAFVLTLILVDQIGKKLPEDHQSEYPLCVDTVL